MRVAGPKIAGSGSLKYSTSYLRLNAPSRVTAQFQMLFLVVADGNMRSVIEQNICRHQDGIGIKPRIRFFLFLARFILELRHAVHPSDGGKTPSITSQFRMCGHMRLHKNGAMIWINTARNITRGNFT